MPTARQKQQQQIKHRSVALPGFSSTSEFLQIHFAEHCRPVAPAAGQQLQQSTSSSRMRGPPDYDRRGWGGGPRGRMGPPPMMDGRGPYGGPPPGGFRGGFGGPPPGMGMGEHHSVGVLAMPQAAAAQQTHESCSPLGAGPPMEKLPPPITVDREKTCPLLLRVFPKRGGHHKCVSCVTHARPWLTCRPAGPQPKCTHKLCFSSTAAPCLSLPPQLPALNAMCWCCCCCWWRQVGGVWQAWL